MDLACRTARLPEEALEAISAYPGVSSLDSMERSAIEGALARWDGNRTKAARDLGISRRTMLYQIKRWGLDRLP
jgi:DNA-binding NtrC family response regulator